MILKRFLTQQTRNIELDFVRGLAILLVIGTHALSLPTSNRLFRGTEVVLKTFGWTGVDLFFVLSGFLVGGVLLSEYRKTQQVDVKRFIIRRGLKIWPPYYFYILFQVIVHRHPLKSFLWANLFHVQNYVGSSLKHTWTLSLEEHFYLLLALTFGWMVLRKWSTERMVKTFVIAMCAVFVIRCFTWFLGFREMVVGATHTRIDSLLCGVVLAAMLQFYPNQFDRLTRRKTVLLLATAFAVVFVALVHDQKAALMDTIGFTIIYLGYAAFMLLVYRHSGVLRDLLIYQIVAKIGVYSYGIYLWHLAVRDWCAHFALRFGPALQWPAAIVAQYTTAIVLGTMLTLLIEWPSLRLRDRLFPAKGNLHSLIDSPADSSVLTDGGERSRTLPTLGGVAAAN
jgi:peptidoglycan/LPS O-acetylase OafA/YrhL